MMSQTEFEHKYLSSDASLIDDPDFGRFFQINGKIILMKKEYMDNLDPSDEKFENYLIYDWMIDYINKEKLQLWKKIL